jgi:hypothetical protein
MLIETFQVTGIGPTLFGRNGGGDPYHTDGEITEGVLSPGAVPSGKPPAALPTPPIVSAKNQIWNAAKQALARD